MRIKSLLEVPISAFVMPPNIRRLVRALFWALACLTAVVGLWLILAIVTDALTTNVYERDFYQDWLLARALSVGGDPFLSLSEMAQHYGGTEWHWQFVSPHPLTLGLLVMPLSWLPYPTAALGWLAISISSYFAALALLQRSLRFAPLLLLGLALTVWFPVRYDWQVGNTSSVLLLCLVGMLLAFKANYPSLIGVMLGVALLIKPICWPIALLLIVRGQWRAVLTASATLAVGYALVALFFGPELIIRYITEVLPNASTFSDDPWSISIWDMGPRLFGGPAMTVIHAPFDWPLGLTIVGLGLPLLLLILTYIGSLRLSLPWALCLVTCLTPVISPVSWYHYLTLLILPASQIFDWLRVQRFPLVESSLALAIGLLILASSRDSSYWLPPIAAMLLAMLCYWIAPHRRQAKGITVEI